MTEQTTPAEMREQAKRLREAVFPEPGAWREGDIHAGADALDRLADVIDGLGVFAYPSRQWETERNRGKQDMARDFLRIARGETANHESDPSARPPGSSELRNKSMKPEPPLCDKRCSRPATHAERTRDISVRQRALNSQESRGRISSRQARKEQEALNGFRGYRRCTRTVVAEIIVEEPRRPYALENASGMVVLGRYATQEEAEAALEAYVRDNQKSARVVYEEEEQ